MMEYDEFEAMNTRILVAAQGKRRDLERAFSRVRRLVAASEARFSRFRETSELCALNRAAGAWTAVSEDMYALLEQAVQAYDLTGGLFDPTVLTALKAVGYDRSMDQIRRQGANPGTQVAYIPQTAPGFERLRLDPEKGAVWMPSSVQIDLGGIAKGWIAAQAADLLSGYTRAGAVSAGGDMVLFGVPAGEAAWQVSLEDPRDPNAVLAVLSSGPGAVATSSVTKRTWSQQGHTRHHIIDPRSQLPATSPWLSVTVMTASAVLAEAMAKALLIGGPEKAQKLAKRVEGFRYLAVLPDGRIVGNAQPLEVQLV